MSDPAPALSGSEIVARARAQFPHLSALRAPAWLVGGAVRDLVAGRPSRDADLALHGVALEAPRFAAATRGRLVRLGEEPFDVHRVVVGSLIYDFAEIVGSSIEDDLGRRDFTIGAVAVELDPPHSIIDPFDGLRDLRERAIRLVRESNLDDDPLRVLRGVRCAAELGFEIEAETMSALRRHAAAITRVAPERVVAELETLLSSCDADRSLRLLESSGLAGIVLPPGSSGIRVPAGLDMVGTLALLAGDLRGESLLAYFRSWRWRESTAAAVASLRALCDQLSGDAVSLAAIAIAFFDAGREASSRCPALLRARGMSARAQEIANVLESDGRRIFSLQPLLDGREIALIAGIEPGPRVGEIKRALVVAQLRREVATRGEAEDLVRVLA